MRRLRGKGYLAVAAVVVLGSVGCGSDTTGPSQPSLASQFWSLSFDQHAVTLATITPYDTATLTATPRRANGDLLVTPDTVVYTSTDTAVSVTPAGQLQAHATATKTGILIIATMTVGGVHGVTLQDTAVVNVVKQTSAASVPRVRTFTIHPADSTARASSLTAAKNWKFPASVLDSANKAIPSVQVHYHAGANPIGVYTDAAGTVLHVNNSVVTAVYPIGKVMLHADAMIYGRAVADSFLLTIGYPLAATVTIAPNAGFTPHTVVIGAGGTVYWQNTLPGGTDSADVEFADPTNVAGLSVAGSCCLRYFIQGKVIFAFANSVLPSGGGDVGPFVPYTTPLPVVDTTVTSTIVVSDTVSARGRVFPMAGTYAYHSRFFQQTGVVQVISNADMP